MHPMMSGIPAGVNGPPHILNHHPPRLRRALSIFLTMSDSGCLAMVLITAGRALVTNVHGVAVDHRPPPNPLVAMSPDEADKSFHGVLLSQIGEP